MQYVLIDNENDQAFGPFDSEYDAKVHAVDLMKLFGEIDSRTAKELKSDINQNGERFRDYGSGRMAVSWTVMELQSVTQ